MKHFLCLMGQLCPISNLYKTKLSAMVAVMTLFMCLIAAFKAPAQTGAAANTDEIQPLQIGDTIPEELWHLPLQVVNHPEGKETITLNDYRGKLIILDFWATWCGSCLLTMPKMHDLEQHYINDIKLLPVTYQPMEDVTQLLSEPNRDPFFESVRPHLYSVFGDTALTELFPHRYLPHLVILNKNRVTAITEPIAITAEIIPLMLADESFVILPKQEQITTSLLAPQTARKPDIAFHSALTSYQPEYMLPAGLKIDSVNNTQWLYYVNNTVLRLYAFAYESGLPLTPNRRILDVLNPQKYEYSVLRNRFYSIKNDSYSYEAVVPVGMAEEDLFAKMRNDLDFFLGLTSDIKPVKIPCIIIKNVERTMQSTRADTLSQFSFVFRGESLRTDERQVNITSQRETNIRNAPMKILPGLLENLYMRLHDYDHNLPVVIDESDYKGNVDLFFSNDSPSVEEYLAEIREMGIDVQIEDRELKMFILSERGEADIHNELGTLQLGKFGYVSKP